VRVSVVVPTYKRPESLACCLDALDRQERPADETIVVVRGEDLDSQAVVRARGERVRLVEIHRPGVVAAMNAGIDASSGDVVALTDDDAAPHADWLARMVATYEGDRTVAAVGGRDQLYIAGERWSGGSACVVGTISRLGVITGNHHMGVGPARDVDVLKGVNLSVRGDLLREARIDERLRGVGTEHHWELALCLSLRARGLRVVYDPDIAVDHHPQPRIDDSRQFSPAESRDAAYNKTLAVLEYLPRSHRPLYLAWAFAVGTSAEPGLAQLLRALATRGAGAFSRFLGTQAGVIIAARARRRSPRADPDQVI
jgi:glycosyltransferase involved in cell wall biosynthesis